MKIKNDNLNHVCLTESLCIKGYSSCKSSTSSTLSKCSLCDIYFHNQMCLLEHFKKKHDLPTGDKLSSCQLFKYCHDCNSIVRCFHFINAVGHKRNHNCKKTFCKICKTIRMKYHNCFFPIPEKLNGHCNNKIEICIYDFETRTDTEQLGILVPYYCIVHKFCNFCIDKKFKDLTTSVSKCCGERCYKFSGNECLEKFTAYFIEVFKKENKSRWFAHNASKFNCLFLLKQLVCKSKLNPKCITN